jgi:hypothetical protein
MRRMNQSNQRNNTVTEFPYRGHKVEIKLVVGVSALKNGYAIYIDGYAWAWGWQQQSAARRNAIKVIDSEHDDG